MEQMGVCKRNSVAREVSSVENSQCNPRPTASCQAVNHPLHVCCVRPRQPVQWWGATNFWKCSMSRRVWPSWPCDAGRKEQSILRACHTSWTIFCSQLGIKTVSFKRMTADHGPFSFFGILGRNSCGLDGTKCIWPSKTNLLAFMCRWVWIVTQNVSECQNPPQIHLCLYPKYCKTWKKKTTNLNDTRLVLGLKLYKTQGEHLTNPNHLMAGNEVSSTTTTTAACCPKGRVVWLEDSSWNATDLASINVVVSGWGMFAFSRLCTLFVHELWMIHSICSRIWSCNYL